MTLEEILTDFRRRYENTYVMVQAPSSDEKTLYYVERITAAENRYGMFTLFSHETGRITLNFGSAHTISFVPPPVGVFQYEGNAYCCGRKPQKQYRRGICSDNTTIVPVASIITREAVEFNIELVAAAFDKKVYQLATALELLKQGRYRGVALQDNFALTLPFAEGMTDYVLFHWDLPVAYVNEAGKVTLTLEQVFAKQIAKVIGG